ncbi:dihydroneopterin aldolase [Tranquillimonas rosea]|uniref:dihydroneopterin aldolase n=1 Tax=Tranquillimonas rosea TaxID=641238 RepID=A0A1H9WER6_9RHOB|nr:dihydroneopterin aldolase [Tranquillimonas rosea]SES32418.1 dihydroneopterin aldolase [Tranquillimonas rosea]
MTSELRLAFAHPEERARATQPGDPHDRISLRDHVVEVEIGAFQPERGKTQRVRFNVVVDVRPHDAARDDDVDKILSYDTITDAIEAELSAERLNLLETLAERVAERILLAPLALRCFVRIEKLDRGPGALGVEIARSSEGMPRLAEEIGADDAPHPLVVFLSNDAIASDRLSAWLDALESDGRPVIFAVGPADVPAPQSGAAAAQRRIDLLAIEQNAWVLAGRDRRCVVVETRTEFDWAMRHGRITVWAPSKLVLDAVEPPSAQPRDAVALAGWFAGQMHARELLCVGAPAPTGASVPVETAPLDAATLV